MGCGSSVGGRTPAPRRSPLAGVRIPETEKRGITVGQLEALLDYVGEHCSAGNWTTTNPHLAGQALQPESINLYDVVHWVVKPVTRVEGCSYVEWAAAGEQVPLWFVSHWWGEAVSRFITCLRQHREDRGLEQGAPYWVCAYANNQWAAAGEVGDDPALSSFRRAMELAQGTVTILDPEAKTFTRIWCGYEIYVSLVANLDSRAYLYDVYTALDDSTGAVGLTDGPTAVDGHDKAKLMRQSDREKRFPLSLSLKALATTIEEAEASEEKDKTHILNSISGQTDLDAHPPAVHQQYDNVNCLLRGRFAAGAWRRALETGSAEDLRRCSEALAVSGSSSIKLSLVRCDRLRPNFWSLLQALPQAGDNGLRSLELALSGTGLGDQECSDLAAGLAKLPQLRSLMLDLYRNSVEAEGAKALAAGVAELPQLGSLELHLQDNSIGAEGAEALAAGVAKLPHLASLKLDLENNSVGNEGAKALAAAIAELSQLGSLELRLQDNSIGAEGAEALAAGVAKLPHLGSLKLELCSNSVGAEGAKALAAGVAKLPHLGSLKLELISNSVGTEGAKALAAGVAELPQLGSLVLHLTHNSIGAEGAEALAAGVAKIPHLGRLVLLLANNFVGDEGAKALAAGVAELSQLGSLVLGLNGNSVGPEGGKALAAARAKLQQIGCKAVIWS